MASITLPDFLTPLEIKKAQVIFLTDRANFHKRCLEEIIQPNMDRINRQLGQENDPNYLTYVVEYVLGLVLK